MTEQALDIAEVTTALNVSRNTVLRLITSGELRARKVGRQWRVRPSWIDEYLNESSPALTAPTSAANGADGAVLGSSSAVAPTLSAESIAPATAAAVTHSPSDDTASAA